MARIAQQELKINWKEIENSGNPEIMRLIVEHLPDNDLMKNLRLAKGKWVIWLQRIR